MPSINLQGLKAIKPQATREDLDPRVVPESQFKYKDIKLDLEFSSVNNNLADNTAINTKDLLDLRDIHDIKQSIYNMFNTMPGQKLLNPYFGLNLAHYCFEPITRITADRIARTILLEAPRQEPRMAIRHLTVEGNIELNQYNIVFNIHIDDADLEARWIKGKLNSDGFKFEQG